MPEDDLDQQLRQVIEEGLDETEQCNMDQSAKRRFGHKPRLGQGIPCFKAGLR